MQQNEHFPNLLAHHICVLRRRTGLTADELSDILQEIPDNDLHLYRYRVLNSAWPRYMESWIVGINLDGAAPDIRSAFARSYVASYCLMYNLAPSSLRALELPEEAALPVDGKPPSLDALVNALGELWANDRWR